MEADIARALLDAESQIAAMQAALAKASHHRDCNTNGLICKNCDKWFREHGIATDACPDRDSVFEEVRGCCNCNCYLSTLSDDIERGKELLGALRERDEAIRAMNDGIRQNAAQVDRLVAEIQRQAVEIEELRKDKERLDRALKDMADGPRDGEGDYAVLWEPRNGHGWRYYRSGCFSFEGKTPREAIDAAMKEKP